MENHAGLSKLDAMASETKRRELEKAYSEHFRFTHQLSEDSSHNYDILNPYDYSRRLETTSGTGR